MEISFDDFYDLKKLILNDEKLMKEIKSSRKDVETGKIHELKNIEELDEVWV